MTGATAVHFGTAPVTPAANSVTDKLITNLTLPASPFPGRSGHGAGPSLPQGTSAVTTASKFTPTRDRHAHARRHPGRRRGGDDRRARADRAWLRSRCSRGWTYRRQGAQRSGNAREWTSARTQRPRGKATIGHRLPGEHGFRFFPGFYKHLIDTMAYPFVDGRTAADHSYRRRAWVSPNTESPRLSYRWSFHARPAMRSDAARHSAAFGPIADLTPEELAFFGARLWQILTSCGERRLANTSE